jgi:hypothetical protein
VIASDGRILAREAAMTTFAAGTIAAVLLWVGPPGVDLAAHAYQRTLLVNHGFVLWNNFWYAGRYSFVTYSFIYYPLAVVLGIKALAVATISAAALAFTLLVWREWGPVGRLSSRTFAVLWAGIALSAAFPFALGVALALLGLTAMQRGRLRLFAVLVVLTLLASPLAFLLLLVLLAGVGSSSRVPHSRIQHFRFIAGVVAFSVLLELALYRLFPGSGRFPFGPWNLVPAVLFCLFGIVITRDVPTARPLRGIFWIYLAACLTAYIVPSALGSNVERLRYAALPIVLLAVSLRRWRPAWLMITGVVLAAVWNVTPLASSFAQASSDPAGTPAYWASTVSFLHSHLSPSFRVEAVDTVDHWPAEFLPTNGIPIVRGWYRQNDFPENELLYDPKLSPAAYGTWLRQLGVRYVVISDAPPDYSSRVEARLVRSGRSGLRPVFRAEHVTLYEVPNARPLVTGPGLASVQWLWPSRAVLAISRPGRYRVALRWSPYWATPQGCVSRGADGMVRLSVRRPGLVQLSFSPTISSGLETLAGVSSHRRCG